MRVWPHGLGGGILALLMSVSSAFCADFVNNGNGTVTDKSTGLTWQKGQSQKELNWNAASKYCGRLSLGGHTDWRLPGLVELRSILDPAKSDPSIDTGFFPGTRSWYYWTAKAGAADSSDAWCISFEDGDEDNFNKTVVRFARCVRSTP